MRRLILSSLAVVVSCGCQIPGPQQAVQHNRKMGPPPPGYYRVVGGAVADWQPSDMLRSARNEGHPLSWEFVGARPIYPEYFSGGLEATGRCVSVAVHPTDPDTVYVASASGGLWKTIDAGTSWAPMTDELAVLNHGCVALDPSNPNTVYLGTGEYTIQSKGTGLYRSTDAGETFERIVPGSIVGTQCSKIFVDPADSDIIHLTGTTGYHRSTDGGVNWTNLLPGTASDLALDPANPQRVFVASHYDGIYRSIDGGTTLSKLTNGLPVSGVGRVLLSQCDTSPDTLYAVFVTLGGDLLGFYQTTDGGDSWTVKPDTPNFPGPAGWYCCCVKVDPLDPNIVYAGGVYTTPGYSDAGMIRTADGGDTWTDITFGAISGSLHPDMHAIAIGPDGAVWCANDGGVWKTTDSGLNWINCNETLEVVQNYTVAVHPHDPEQMMTGTQDNGTIGRDSDSLVWPQIVTGDGGFLAYDFDDPSRFYTTYIFLTVFRIEDSGWADITGPWGGDPVEFIAPLVMDPNDPHTLFGGTNRVWKTSNAHTDADWTPISTTAVAGGGRLTSIAVAPIDSNVIYSGSTSGNVFYTDDQVTWLDRTPADIYQLIADIVIDPGNADVAYVAVVKKNANRILRTDDAGQTWADLTGDLPASTKPKSLAVDWRHDPPALAIGTGAGVYYSSNGGENWYKDGPDLPNVNIGDLAIDPIHHDLIAGTYGRGAWRARLPGPGISGDFDGDGQVDLNDFATFALCYTGAEVPPVPGCEICDLDDDNDVDLADFATFAVSFTG